MKISERLTRAGIVFIMLGTLAVVLPSNGDTVALADNCSIGGHTFSLTPNTPQTISNSTHGETHFHAVFDGNSASTTSWGLTNTANGFTVSPSTGSDVNVSYTGSGDTNTLMATYTDTDTNKTKYVVTVALTGTQ